MALKYKAGDQVRIKNLDWYNKNIKNNGIIICGSESFTHPMSHFCDKIVTIVTIQDNCYRILEDDGDWYWTDEMIEGLVEEEIVDLTLIVMETVEEKTIQNTLTYGYNLPDGYIFKDENGNVINATKIVLEKKKKEYPKTFEECVHVLEGENRMSLEQMNTFRKLIDARNAYWKIYGEENGLGKPWEPDGNAVYAITRNDGYIVHIETGGNDEVLEFPIAEMRDQFQNNFNKEIEICKNLL